MKVEKPINLKEVVDYIDKDIKEQKGKTPQQCITYIVFDLSESTIQYLEARNFEYNGYAVEIQPSANYPRISSFRSLEIKNFLS